MIPYVFHILSALLSSSSYTAIFDRFYFRPFRENAKYNVPSYLNLLTLSHSWWGFVMTWVIFGIFFFTMSLLVSISSPFYRFIATYFYQATENAEREREAKRQNFCPLICSSNVHDKWGCSRVEMAVGTHSNTPAWEERDPRTWSITYTTAGHRLNQEPALRSQSQVLRYGTRASQSVYQYINIHLYLHAVPNMCISFKLQLSTVYHVTWDISCPYIFALDFLSLQLHHLSDSNKHCIHFYSYTAFIIWLLRVM